VCSLPKRLVSAYAVGFQHPTTCPPPNLPRTRGRNSLPACEVGWGGGDVLSLRIGTHYATDIPTDAREFPVDAVDIPAGAWDIRIDAVDIPADIRDIPIDAADIPAG